MAQRVGRGIALLFHDRSTRRWVSGQQHAPAALYPRKDPVPILHEAGRAPGPVWTDGESRPHRDSIPDRPARSQSLYRLSYRAHTGGKYSKKNLRGGGCSHCIESRENKQSSDAASIYYKVRRRTLRAYLAENRESKCKLRRKTVLSAQ